MDELLEKSNDIVNKAILEYKPKIVVAMVSGGDDSLTAFKVAQRLNVKIDFIMHGNTRTGIEQTTKYVRQLAIDESLPYIEADAKDAYEKYVLRKGFFGLGKRAHTYCYHVIKATYFRKAISSIRQRRRNFKVLLLNGARKSESENRKNNLTQDTNIDPSAKSNIWVNIINHWDKTDCQDFLVDEKVTRNPVTEVLCRSGECMCGTMQSQEQRAEAAYWFPDFGDWLLKLEQKVWDNGFWWRWGEHIPSSHEERQAGQLDMFDGVNYDFLPMCHSCNLKFDHKNQSQSSIDNKK